MAAYIKFDGVDGECFYKIGEFKTYPAPRYTDAGRVTTGITKWTANAKASLKDAGMSQQGIMALTTGGQVTDKKDKAIVNGILASILN